MFETWASNPSLFELLLLLFDRSEFLAEAAIRTPDLVDELALSGRLRRAKSAEETLKDLRYGAGDADQRLWIRRYHQAEQMRIGLRDILGLSDFEQNLGELTALATACVQYALETVLTRYRLKKAPFAVVGMGKLGGAELTYGSDLDVLFVAPGNRTPLAKLHQLATETMDLLASQTELGTAYQIDARLRPDGAKGLLVNTLKAFEDYYRQRAMLWEIQTLTRARFVAGDVKVGRQFEELAAALSNFRVPNIPLAAYKPDWMTEIARMRVRIEKERTPAGQQALAFKTGAGGLIDAEFMAQAMCMAYGWREPNTLKALYRARQHRILPAEDADALIENFGRLQRLEGTLRRWSYVGESVLPNDPAPQYRVAVRCGFADAPSFLNAVNEWRAAIRKIYERFFSIPPGSPHPKTDVQAPRK
jgi:glutamate-ammonia-ligase adenylyltransferase